MYEVNFDLIKEIGKELLFAGASRTIRNSNGQTPLEILNNSPNTLK